ncbi:MAG: glycoside hydrolase family 97 protein [Cyclobacteriaceae bacterium]|nr:glycoside hydrolase family 97 protein [Cyclobacteriaceae bacterium]
MVLAIGLMVGVLSSCTSNNELHTLESPDKMVRVTFSDEGNILTYRLSWQGQEMLGASELSIFPDVPVRIVNTEVRTSDSKWNPVWGQFDEIRDHYAEMLFELDMDGAKGKLIARAYDQGVGFRFELSEFKAGEHARLYCEYALGDSDALYCPNGENEPLGPLAIQQLKTDTALPNIVMPVVVEKSNGTYLSVLESDLYSAEGFKLMHLDFNQDKGLLFSSNEITLSGEKMATPWRTILLEDKAGDLLTNTVSLNLAAPCQLENTSWIKPGKALWDWRVHGYTAPDGFVYGIDNESYNRFIDFAADKGIEYFLIDAGWFSSAANGQFEVAENLDLQKVFDSAAEKGVEMLLYYDRHKGDYGDDELYAYFQSLGAKGIKYGFMGADAEFTREAVRKSAQNKLLINFHDHPLPITGISRTYPNAITREYCHAQQDSRRAFTPESFIKMAMINAIQGPLDMNNGNFDLSGINAGKRQKGPKELNSYLSTVVAEAARTLIIFSGLVCIPDAPEAYEAKNDLFGFIQRQAVGQWNESLILNAKIGEYITTVRRHGKEWFVGSVINQQGGTLDIKLDFLEEGLSYEATFYEDTQETDCKTNPEAYSITKAEVEKGQIIHAKMAKGGGHCIWIQPKNDE